MIHNSVHEVRGGHAGHHVHVYGGSGECRRSGVGRGLGGGDGARIEVQVPHLSTEIGRWWTVHGCHGTPSTVRVLLLLDLDWLGHLLVSVRLSLELALQLGKRHSQHRLQVAHKAVDVPLPRHLVDDVLVVVVAQTSAQLLVVHLGLVLARAPSSSNLLGVNQLELPLPPCPGDAVLAVSVCQQLQQELP